jgi:hypothetical protein
LENISPKRAPKVVAPDSNSARPNIKKGICQMFFIVDKIGESPIRVMAKNIA